MRRYADWALVLIGIALVGCGDKGGSTPTADSSSSTTGKPADAAPAGGGSLTKLETKDVKVGTGPGAKDGDTLVMTYTGTLKDGTPFDSNDKPGGQPFRFRLGAGSVIKGWDQGMVGMKKGGERKLSIPSSLGYGANAQGDKIPANSDLYFDVKLNSLITNEAASEILSDDKKKGTGDALKMGQTATIEYTIVADDNTVAFNTYEKKPYTFKLGNGDVLPAVEQGMVGMKVGGERQLTIPSAYGPRGTEFTSENPYKFDIHLIKIAK